MCKRKIVARDHELNHDGAKLAVFRDLRKSKNVRRASAHSRVVSEWDGPAVLPPCQRACLWGNPAEGAPCYAAQV
jgi:hypothetical protein